MDIFQLNT